MAHIITRLITEKGAMLESKLVYAFEVNTNASKNQIAQALLDLYGEKPLKINVVTRPPQSRRVGKYRKELLTQPRKIAYAKMKNPLKSVNT